MSFSLDPTGSPQGSGNMTWRSEITSGTGDNYSKWSLQCGVWGFWNGSIPTQNIPQHVAVVYEHENHTSKQYINGILNVQYNNITIPRTHYTYCVLGCGFGNCYWIGTIEEFRISDGIARWTENFTPPTSPYTPT